ncbi:MAG: hypothetical protein OXU66_04825 [Gammaproteobacteria bacterium]|nr:hypothetical protein [Gammaproteobacteria bacterium]
MKNTEINFVGARKGATGTLADLQDSPPAPKAWVNPAIMTAVINRLISEQHTHSRLDLHALIQNHFFDADNNRYRFVWSKNMITSAGVSKIKTKSGKEEMVLHFRDGEEERKSKPRWMRKILEGLHAKGGRAGDSVEDFIYLTLVHEANEIHIREEAEVDTLVPDVKAEVHAEIEEAKAYFALSAERKKVLLQLYKMLDETDDPRKAVYSGEIEVFESIGEEKLGTIAGLLKLISYVLEMPDYVKEANLYNDDRTRQQLARSLFVDVLHDFSGASPVDN